MEIYKRMISILHDIDAIKKDRKSQQGYNFRGIDDMYNALHHLFAKYEVFISSKVLKIEREERQSLKGGNLIYTIIEIEFSFFTIDGSSVQSIMIGEAMDSGDKSANKAMSTALKYALMQSFLIPTKELIDSDNDTYEVAKKQPKNPELDENPGFDIFPETKDLSEKFFNSWDGNTDKLPYVNLKGKIWKLAEKHINQLQSYIEIEIEKAQYSSNPTHER